MPLLYLFDSQIFTVNIVRGNVSFADDSVCGFEGPGQGQKNGYKNASAILLAAFKQAGDT